MLLRATMETVFEVKKKTFTIVMETSAGCKKKKALFSHIVVEIFCVLWIGIDIENYYDRVENGSRESEATIVSATKWSICCWRLAKTEESLFVDDVVTATAAAALALRFFIASVWIAKNEQIVSWRGEIDSSSVGNEN